MSTNTFPEPPPSERDSTRDATQSDGSQQRISLTEGFCPIEGYVLRKELGAWGFGAVWQVEGPGGVQVAMKFIPENRAEQSELRSLELMKETRHAHLLGMSGYWRKQGFIIIAMELADCTLSDLFQKYQKQGLQGIPREELFEYLDEIAKGIDYLNGQGIQHRDIKPQNLLIVGGTAKLGDFGLAKLLRGSITGHTGHCTPFYAAPEFFKSETATTSDQYCFAVTYCLLRGGKLPFRGDVAGVVMGHLQLEPNLTRLPTVERPIVARALSKVPNERWPSCRDFIRALQATETQTHLQGHASPIEDVPTTDSGTRTFPLATPSPKPNKLFLTALSLGAILLLAGVGLWLRLSGNGPGNDGTGTNVTSPGSKSIDLEKDRSKDGTALDNTTRSPNPLLELAQFLGALAIRSERRERSEPEFVLDAGGLTADCNDLCVTPDGKQVVAVGDDKVARIWKFEKGKLDIRSTRVLRWDVWREQQGTISAMAFAPLDDGWKIAIGGLGATDAAGAPTVGVFDFEDGELLESIALPNNIGQTRFGMVQAIDFAPGGSALAFGTAEGSIWWWDYKDHVRLGGHNLPGEDSGKEFVNIRLVKFWANNRLLTVAGSGEVKTWDPTKPNDPSLGVFTLGTGKVKSITRAAVSPDNQWLAATQENSSIVIRSIDGEKTNPIALRSGEYGNAIAFSPDGSQLAVAIGSWDGKGFFLEGNDRIDWFDLTESPPQKLGSIPQQFHVDRITYSPDGKSLVAIGGDHDVLTWDLSNPDTPQSITSGVGESIWDIAISKDGNAIGVRTQRDPESEVINQRAKGEWDVFDLFQREYVDPKTFQAVEMATTLGGWTVEPDPSNRYRWYLVHKENGRFPLPYDAERNGLPRCYAFLDATDNYPIRLVVGHTWGASIYDVQATGPRFAKLCIGHASEVVALGISADQKWMVTGGLDQTVAAWRLDHDWKYQKVLGANFAPVGNRLRVTAVDEGSPAWEAGLVEDDEVLYHSFGENRGELATGPTDWLKHLRDPEPGKENLFIVERDKGKQPVKMATMLKTRPIWKFFATRQKEWILWMWQHPFYDSSTRGDFYLGWQVNHLDTEKAPTFYRAEQLRKHYRKNGLIDKLLQTRDPKKALAFLGSQLRLERLDERDPSAIEVSVGQHVPGKGRQVVLQARTRNISNPDNQLKVAEVWINDYRYSREEDLSEWTHKYKLHEHVIHIPEDKFRTGQNVVTLRMFNRLGWEAEGNQTLTIERDNKKPPRLWGLAVGINDYSKAGGVLGDLKTACNDAAEIHKAFSRQQYFQSSNLQLLLDAKASRETILEHLTELSQKVDADDLVLVYLSGHGMSLPRDSKDVSKGNMYLYCCPQFEPNNPLKTGITDEKLMTKLAEIPCQKIVLLDTSHSGTAVVGSAPREVSPSGQGPTILAACDPTQQAFEDPKLGSGLFTHALAEVLTVNMAPADLNEDNFLDSDELMEYAEERVPELLAKMKRPIVLQTPIMFAPSGAPPIRLGSLAKEKEPIPPISK